MTSTDTIRVMIADDHPMMREGIAASLCAHGGIEIVAEAADGDEAIHCFSSQRPDVALVDLQMPGKDGLEAIRAIRSLHPDARLIVLTTYDGDARIAAALKAGASAYLLKNVPGRELAATVREVHNGSHVLPQALRREVAIHYAGDALSPRELDVLRLAALGHSNRAIGGHLHIGETTVKTHMSTILVKLGANDRAHAVTLAAQRGYIDL
ncbi:response regulator [uncultured Massilia sp.]|uniref:response regulator transcription factor n=1 Tax=uncultured Massilia sp. TaxID=169973 RepID=UPI0025FA03AC|nr:response regulator transcription factor [uncultured Massilia sp.]